MSKITLRKIEHVNSRLCHTLSFCVPIAAVSLKSNVKLEAAFWGFLHEENFFWVKVPLFDSIALIKVQALLRIIKYFKDQGNSVT